jgi:hypothetical protein
MYINIAVYPETRARFNIWKAQQEARRGESVTADDIINELLDMAEKGVKP